MAESTFGVTIKDDDWADSSSPGWEDCTVLSIAESVRRKLRVSSQAAAPRRQPKHSDQSGASDPLPPSSSAAHLHAFGRDQLRAGDFAAAVKALEMPWSCVTMAQGVRMNVRSHCGSGIWPVNVARTRLLRGVTDVAASRRAVLR